MKPRDKARWHQIKEIFDEADEISSEDLPAFLEQRCQGDVELRQEVEALLNLGLKPDLAIDRLKVPRIASPAIAVPAGPRLEPGDLIARRYRIARFIASGGMGEVYEAREINDERPVALKCIRQSPLGSGGKSQTRFLREAKLALQIDHPSVCRVFEHFEHQGENFIAMEFIEGETLASRLDREGRFSPEAALPIARQLCDGLEAAHRAGVLHRDLKPGNIQLTADDRAVIIDFGLAAHTLSEHSLTSTGAVIGTLAYVAPEQLESGQCSVASDIYSLGVLLYEMLAGEKPHPGKSPFRLAAEKAREAHKRPDVAIPNLPQNWQEVLERCLKAQPQDRLQSAAEVKALLERGKPTKAYVAARWWHKSMVPITVAGALACASVGWAWRTSDYQPTTEAAVLYDQAETALASAAPMRGAQLLEKASSLDPKFVQALALHAVALSELDQQDQARDIVIQAASAADQRVFLGRGEATMLEAARAIVIRDYKTAAEAYRRLARSATSDRRRLYAKMLQARMLEQMGRNDEALAILSEVVKAAPDNWPARVRHAVQLSRQDKKAAAAEFDAAEKALAATGNREGLADALLVRTTTNTHNRDDEYKDMERVIEISKKTDNRYNVILAKLAMAVAVQSKRDYDRAGEIAREAMEQARSENMPVLTARAMAMYGYTFLYKKQPELAEPLLRQSVELAQRAKSYRLLAANQMQWGEALGWLGKREEQYKAMAPAIAFHRQINNPDTLPMTLIKWARVLYQMGRTDEALRTFQEAADLAARRPDMEVMGSTALINIAGSEQEIDFHRQAATLAEAVRQAREVENDSVIFQAAQGYAHQGDYAKAEALVADGDRLVAAYKNEAAKIPQRKYAAVTRLWIALDRGDCANARKAADQVDDNVVARHLMSVCEAKPSALELKKDRQWLESALKSFPSSEWERPITHSLAAAEVALALKDWPGAEAHALRALEGAKKAGHRFREMKADMILRVVNEANGKHEEAAALTVRCRELLKSLNFDRPAEFNGRVDLIRLWRMVPETVTQSPLARR